MNQYRVYYGYQGRIEDEIGRHHPVRYKIFNTFDDAKKFVESLPKIRVFQDTMFGKEYVKKFWPQNLYAKIRTGGIDYWQTPKPEDNGVVMLKDIIGNRETEEFKNLC